MDVGLTAEQLLRDAVRDLLRAECPPGRHAKR